MTTRDDLTALAKAHRVSVRENPAGLTFATGIKPMSCKFDAAGRLRDTHLAGIHLDPAHRLAQTRQHIINNTRVPSKLPASGRAWTGAPPRAPLR